MEFYGRGGWYVFEKIKGPTKKIDAPHDSNAAQGDDLDRA